MYNVFNYDKDQCYTRMWSAGLYLRLSRDDEKYESDSISSQREILKEFVANSTDINVYDTYVDDGWTGTNFNRPSFTKMIDDLKNKKIDCIIVKDLSRFARNTTESAYYYDVVFPYLKTRFICIADTIDSYLDPDSLNNLSMKIKSLLNEEYCRDISNKVKSSLKIKQKRGEYIGSFACYGYEKDKNNGRKILVDPEASEVVKLIYAKYLAGISIRKIIFYLNSHNITPPALYKKKKHPTYNPSSVTKGFIWTQKTVRRILSNRMYLGEMVQHVMSNISYKIQKCRAVPIEQQIIVKGTHDPIISYEDFDDVQKLLFRDTRISPTTQNVNLLSGFIKCGDCKRGMIRKKMTSGNKKYVYYICSTYKNRGNNCCTKHTINGELVEKILVDFFKKHIKLCCEMEKILNAIKESPVKNNKSERLNLELEKVELKLEKLKKISLELYPDFKNGIIDKEEYNALKRKYNIEIETTRNEYDEIVNKIKQIESDFSSNNQFILNYKKYVDFEKLDRQMICALIENIYVYEGNRIEIIMKHHSDFESALEYIDVNSRLASLNVISESIKESQKILKKAE